MFIVIEGGDGTGKSTLTTHMAEHLGGVTYATPPRKYKKYREQIDREASAQQHYDFYREAVLDASCEVQQMLTEGKRVVCDRYWISTVAYHEAMGLTVQYDDFKTICKPDLTVFLVTSPKIQIRRMLARGMSSGDKRMLDRQQEICAHLFKALVSSESPFIAIDTGSFSSEDAARLVAGAIK